MKCFLILVLITVVTAIARERCPTSLSKAQQNTILSAHNQIRQAVANGDRSGLQSATNMLELVWSKDVARKAQDWANNGLFDHDKVKDRMIYDENNNEVNMGQNIGLTDVSSNPDLKETVDNFFYEEEEDLKAYNVINSFSLKYLTKYGHASQVCWAQTKAIGCGISSTTYGNTEYCMLVCNYAPPGNYPGKSVYIEGETATECPNGRQSSIYSGLCANPGGLI